ncbi:unnamed protein product [Chrysoparadoxa australica]
MSSFAEGRINCGINLGARQAQVSLPDGEIIRNELGGIGTANVVAFAGRERLVGEKGAQQLGTAKAVDGVHTLAGADFATISSSPASLHWCHKLVSSPSGEAATEMEYTGEARVFTGTQLLAMLLAKLKSQTIAGVSSRARQAQDHPVCANIALPDDTPERQKQAVICAAKVAGFSDCTLHDASACYCTSYAKKFPLEAGSESERVTLILDVGHLQTSVTVVKMVEGEVPQVLAAKGSNELGAYHFDQAIFGHLAAIVKQKTGFEVLPGTKPGQRLLKACERLRKLLSTIPAASTTAENLCNDSDIELQLNREELVQLGTPLLTKLRSLITETRAAAGAEVQTFELTGGGGRMECVRVTASDLLKLEPGAKIDDAALSFGAALLGEEAVSKPPAPEEGIEGTEENTEGTEDKMVVEDSPAPGLSEAELEALIKEEAEMQALDDKVQAIAEQRNAIEAYVYDMQSKANAGSSIPHGELINKERLGPYLEEAEDWLYSEEADDSSLEQLKDKRAKLEEDCTEMCKEYFDACRSTKEAVEKELEEEARKAEAERAANPEEEDHDFRKLKVADRLRLVMKNKEEGTELFKDGNFRMAGARYAKALTHCGKFHDLSPEDKNEVDAVRLSLYLNLAQCYLKMSNWDSAIANCGHALGVDEANSKALYRRGYALAQKKKWDESRSDLSKCEQSDPAVAKLLRSVDAAIGKQKKAEKAMWGKAFAAR